MQGCKKVYGYGFGITPQDYTSWPRTSYIYIYSFHMSNGLNLKHLRKDVAEMVIVFLCVPHRSRGFNVRNKIRQACVSKVIVFCVTPIVPESFMIVSSINVLA